MSANFIGNSGCPSNFLTGIGFQFQLIKYPKVSFFCQSATVPGISISVANQSTRYNAIPHPGDEINFEDLILRFIVDEGMSNYVTVHNWIRKLGHPYSSQDIQELPGEDLEDKTYSDAVLFILDSNFKKKFKIVFKDIFPTSIGDLTFESTATDVQYFTVTASFKYTIYDIYDINDKKL
jgi:hypothetical protein